MKQAKFRCRLSLFSPRKRGAYPQGRKSRPAFAELMREALGLADSRRRKPVPRFDPVLIRSVSRIDSNVNQIARWLNATTASGHLPEIDAIEIIGGLIAIDRCLTYLIRDNASIDPSVKGPAC